MKKFNTFQAVVFGGFIILLLIGFLGFSGKIPFPSGSKDVNYGEVVLWGTIPSSVMQSTISEKVSTDQNVIIKYVEKNRETFTRDFVEAVASGNAPDLILVAQDEILSNVNKLSLIPYQSVTERVFKDTFIEEGELFLQEGGIVALPLTIDPLIMYWNRDIFTNEGIAAPPRLWDSFYSLSPRLSLRDQKGNIAQSFVAFGEYSNVSNAKEILSTLIMQAGKPIVTLRDGFLAASLAQSIGGVANTGENAENALLFFTQFSKPNKVSYSWNRSLPTSRSMFEDGNLALYFGFASEYVPILKRNPHLNFDITMMPQAGQFATKTTFGRMQGIAVVKASRNQAGAMYAVGILSNRDIVGALAEKMNLPPVRRDLISIRPTDAVFATLYDSALISHAWYDPDTEMTDQIFSTLIDNIVSGRTDINQALFVAQEKIDKLLQAYRKN
ncbi:MAG: extracellular solute-binding protein [Candidatus Yonathbacteria bacterium]|nr:extracellular solute-binding protein [Candidatus Yonathbacteria bacterium]